jgi:hypothetical protein
MRQFELGAAQCLLKSVFFVRIFFNKSDGNVLIQGLNSLYGPFPQLSWTGADQVQFSMAFGLCVYIQAVVGKMTAFDL